MILEFGVYDGWSLKQIAKRFPDENIYGFDSFDGLEEDWGRLHKKGAMKTRIPQLPHNVKLIKGLIENTLPDFLDKHKEAILFVHIDTDTYRPAKFILDHIKGRLLPGCIIIFDEYWNYPGWEEHEYRAFKEFRNENPHIQFSQANGVNYFSRSILSMGWKLLLRRIISNPIRVFNSGINRIMRMGSVNNDPSMSFIVNDIGGAGQ